MALSVEWALLALLWWQFFAGSSADSDSSFKTVLQRLPTSYCNLPLVTGMYRQFLI
jgi:hypothetical protein